MRINYKMRIKSNFVDYYDCMQKYGQSDDILYVRKTEILKEVESRYFKRSLVRLPKEPPCYATPTHLYIYFCSKWYPVVEFLGVYYYDYESTMLKLSEFGYEESNKCSWYIRPIYDVFQDSDVVLDNKVKCTNFLLSYPFILVEPSGTVEIWTEQQLASRLQYNLLRTTQS